MKIARDNDLKKNFLHNLLISIIFLILIFLFIPTNLSNLDEASYKEFPETIQACSLNIYEAINFYQNAGYDYEVIEINDLDIFPNFKNLKCINKVSKIEKYGNYYEIFTSKSQVLEQAMILFLFPLLVLINSNVKQKKFILFTTLSLFHLSYFNYFQFSFIFLINCLLIYMLIYKLNKDNFLTSIIFLYLIYSTHFYSQFNFDSGDELYYIGQIFRVDSEFSAFFLQDHMVLFNNFLKITVDVFNEYFYIFLKTLQALFFCLIVYLYKELFKISNFGIVIFLILFFMFQGLYPTYWLVYNFTPAGVSNLFLLLSIYFVFKSKLLSSTLLLIFTAYVHFANTVIVAPLIIYLFLKKSNVKSTVYYFLIFIFSTSFLIWNILTINLGAKSINLKDSIYYYIAVRHPQNLPFSLDDAGILKNFNPGFGRGFIYTVIGVLILILIGKFSKHVDIFYIEFSIFSIVVFLIYLFVLYLFPISNFALLVPLRLSVFLVFFALLVICKFIDKFITRFKNERLRLVSSIVLIFYFTPFIPLYFNSILDVSTKPTYEVELTFKDASKIELINTIRGTEHASTVLVPVRVSSDIDNRFFQTLEINTQRTQYVNHKFVPHQLSLLPEWYLRINQVKDFYKGNCNSLLNLDKFYYVILKNENDNNGCGSIVFENQSYALYAFP